MPLPPPNSLRTADSFPVSRPTPFAIINSLLQFPTIKYSTGFHSETGLGFFFPRLYSRFGPTPVLCFHVWFLDFSPPLHSRKLSFVPTRAFWSLLIGGFGFSSKAVATSYYLVFKRPSRGFSSPYVLFCHSASSARYFPARASPRGKLHVVCGNPQATLSYVTWSALPPENHGP